MAPVSAQIPGDALGVPAGLHGAGEAPTGPKRAVRQSAGGV